MRREKFGPSQVHVATVRCLPVWIPGRATRTAAEQKERIETMKKTLGLVGAALLVGLPGIAAAQNQTSGFYVGLGAGVNFAVDQGFSNVPRTSATSGDVDFDMGWVGVGSIGYGFGNGLRLEAELGYRSNGADSAFGRGGSGDATVWSGMVNVLYDFATGSAFMPYIGIGVGVANVNYDGIRGGTGNTVRVSGDDTVFAYQGIVGIGYQVAPQWRLGLDYRYFGTTEGTYGSNFGRSSDAEYAAHSVMFGIRYDFNPPVRAAAPAAAPAVAPPPPPPPAVVPQQRAFIVFFDWDRADITPEALAIIRQAAQVARSGNVARITVTGHTDTSGNPRYNQALSERRAAAVRNALAREGVPAAGITTIGRGEAGLLVPTGDNVREPQNRRAEIVLGN